MGQLIDNVKLEASQIGFQTRFNMALNAVDDPTRQFAMEIPSTNAIEQHNWLGAVPGFSEWVDQRKMSKLRAEKVTIVNKDFASGIYIDQNDIKDDRLGVVMPRIDQLAQKGALHYGDLLVQAFKAGFAGASPFGQAYDGQNFFSATHADGDGPTQSNFAGAVALSETSYFAARSSMWSLVDEEGDPLGIVPDTLLVGPSNEKTALQITGAELIPNAGAGVTNVLRGSARVVVSPRFVGAAAGNWVLASLNGAMRPMILQIREQISSSFVDEKSEGAFMNKKLKFGSQGRHNVGYGLWQFAYGSNA